LSAETAVRLYLEELPKTTLFGSRQTVWGVCPPKRRRWYLEELPKTTLFGSRRAVRRRVSAETAAGLFRPI